MKKLIPVIILIIIFVIFKFSVANIKCTSDSLAGTSSMEATYLFGQIQTLKVISNMTFKKSEINDKYNELKENYKSGIKLNKKENTIEITRIFDKKGIKALEKDLKTKDSFIKYAQNQGYTCN